MFLVPLSGRSFVLILTIAQLDITLDLFSLFTWLFCCTSACNLVSIVFVCDYSKG